MIPLALAALCVLANAFFVAAEFALAKVRPTSLEALAKTGDASAARAFAITKELDAYLTATQLGITLASLGLGWLGEPALARIVEPPLRWVGLPENFVHGAGAAVGFTILTLLHIVVGELVPKSLAIQRPEIVAKATSRPLRLFYWLMYPPLRALNKFSNLVLRITGLPPLDNAEGALSVEELRLLIRATLKEEDGSAAKQREVVERVLRSTDRPIRNVMVPRVDMVSLSLDTDWDACVEQMRKHGYSRYPVTETGDPDHVVGYLYVKDLIFAKHRPAEGLRALRRDALFVPETRTVGDLLNDFQSARAQIAIVLDGYGGTAGLVTLEDVVEELVGEIDDEHDVETALRVEKTPDGSVVMDGRTPLDELELEGLMVGEHDPHDTVGAYVIASLGRLAQPGDSVRMGAWLLVVDQVRRRRVTRVTLRPRRPTPHPPDPGAKN